MSTDVKELRQAVTNLQSASAEKELLDILNHMKNDFIVNEGLIRETKAGLAVGKLRSHQFKAVADLSKEIVKRWKTEVERLKPKTEKKPTVSSPTSPSKTTSTANGLKSPTGKSRTAVSDGIKLPTGDKTRDKCIELCYNAIALDTNASNDTILNRATRIESTVFKDNGFQTMSGYKNKMRSLYLNLKDTKNPALRGKVLNKEGFPEELPFLSAKDMASEEMKKEVEQLQDENLFKSLGAEEPAAETDAFQCSRCKQRKCRYRQQQTRSADEPMTTFVTCVNCNHRWKFS